ncbi:MAG: WD40 repeat domain-containing protein [Myxococcota bacterium]
MARLRTEWLTLVAAACAPQATSHFQFESSPSGDGSTEPAQVLLRPFEPRVRTAPQNLPDAGTPFGGPGPWPIAHVTYSRSQGILETPIVGHSTDEAQNRWVATHQALYLLRPGDSVFRRFGSAEGLHLQDNPERYCDSNFSGGDKSCPIFGAAADPGITTIVGGGPNEVFVGYAGIDDGPGDWSDLDRHSGKLDRVRLRSDGTLQVDRFDFVANAHGAQYWHNRTVQRLVFDHFLHPHELYVGMNHGVTLVRPDQFRRPNPGEWFDAVNLEYMADHLHARVCYHAPCDATTSNQRMGDWRGLALSPDGNLWTAGKWTAGKIVWHEDLYTWFSRPGGDTFAESFGDPYPLPDNGNGYVNEPVFRPPAEGDPVHLSAVSVASDGRVWFASDPPASSGDPAYGVAVWDGRRFITFDPVAQLGMAERKVVDLVALPDGRVVVAGPSTGLVVYDPASGRSVPLRAPAYLADDNVQRLELDTMVSPPALHVSTWSGASVLRGF